MSVTGDAKAPRSRAQAGGWLLLAVVVLLGVWVWAVRPAGIEAAMAALLEGARTRPLWGFAVVVALMVAHNVVPVPAEVIAVAAGAVLGPWIGGLAVWCGAMCGAALAFWMARRWGRDLVLRLVPAPYAHKLDHLAERGSWPALLGMRLVPIISFNVVNYAAGLTVVPWRVFLWTTAVGIIPVIALSVATGAGLMVVGLKELMAGLLLLCVGMLVWRVVHARRKAP